MTVYNCIVYFTLNKGMSIHHKIPENWTFIGQGTELETGIKDWQVQGYNLKGVNNILNHFNKLKKEGKVKDYKLEITVE